MYMPMYMSPRRAAPPLLWVWVPPPTLGWVPPSPCGGVPPTPPVGVGVSWGGFSPPPVGVFPPPPCGCGCKLGSGWDDPGWAGWAPELAGCVGDHIVPHCGEGQSPVGFIYRFWSVLDQDEQRILKVPVWQEGIEEFLCKKCLQHVPHISNDGLCLVRAIYS